MNFLAKIGWFLMAAFGLAATYFIGVVAVLAYNNLIQL